MYCEFIDFSLKKSQKTEKIRGFGVFPSFSTTFSPEVKRMLFYNYLKLCLFQYIQTKNKYLSISHFTWPYADETFFMAQL